MQTSALMHVWVTGGFQQQWQFGLASDRSQHLMHLWTSPCSSIQACQHWGPAHALC